MSNCFLSVGLGEDWFWVSRVLMLEVSEFRRCDLILLSLAPICIRIPLMNALWAFQSMELSCTEPELELKYSSRQVLMWVTWVGELRIAAFALQSRVREIVGDSSRVIETGAWSDHVMVSIADEEILGSVHLSTRK